jgi:hypothetical protein
MTRCNVRELFLSRRALFLAPSATSVGTQALCKRGGDQGAAQRP